MATDAAITGRTLKLSERFVASCAPVIDSNFDTAGSVTRASIAYLTAADLGDLFAPGGKFADLDAWFIHAVEMKACGTKRNALYDWIMANADRKNFKSAVDGIKGVKIQSVLHPFIFGRQETIVNRDYWKIVVTANCTTTTFTNGTPATVTTAETGFDKTSAASWNPKTLTKEDGSALAFTDCDLLRITTRHGLPLSTGWFQPRDTIHAFSRTAAGVAEHTTWKVIGSAITTLDDGTQYIDVVATDANFPTSNTAFHNPASIGAKTAIIVPGINNVNDFEAFCMNRPTVDPRKRVPFWVQTFRQSRRVDSEYRLVWKKLFETNPAFREFGDLDLAQKNAQDEADFQHRFINSFFLNKPISSNQTLALWESLESINAVLSGEVLKLVGDSTTARIVAKRANFVGVKEQLRTADRVLDIAAQRFDFYEWLNLNYLILRARESTYRRSITDIDWYTNSIFAAQLASAFVQYGIDEYGGSASIFHAGTAGSSANSAARVTVEVNKVNTMGQTYDTYRVKRPAGVNINILVDRWFDDFRDEMSAISSGSAGDTAYEERGNLLVALDIGKPGAGTIYWAHVAANRKVYNSAKIEELAKVDSTYRCVMETISEEQTLTSQTGTVVVEAPLCSCWIENFSDGIEMTAHQNTTTGAGLLLDSKEPDVKGGFPGSYV